MNKNIIILIFLSLMVGSAVYLGVEFKRLEQQKKELAVEKADVVRQRNKIDSLKNIFQSQNEIAQKIVSEIKPKNLPDSLHRLISRYENSEAVIQKSISDPEKNALAFERAGFEAIINNNFAVARSQFNNAEKAFPSFHMSYEISKLLKSRQADFGDKEKEENIKIQIYKKYSWKAPKDLISQIGNQIAP